MVSAPACHFCDDADRVLADLSREFLLEVEHLALESEDGRRLAAHHRPSMTPLVLVEGIYFSSGRLHRGKLAKYLTSHTDSARPEPVASPIGASHG